MFLRNLGTLQNLDWIYLKVFKRKDVYIQSVPLIYTVVCMHVYVYSTTYAQCIHSVKTIEDKNTKEITYFQIHFQSLNFFFYQMLIKCLVSISRCFLIQWHKCISSLGSGTFLVLLWGLGWAGRYFPTPCVLLLCCLSCCAHKSHSPQHEEPFFPEMSSVSVQKMWVKRAEFWKFSHGNKHTSLACEMSKKQMLHVISKCGHFIHTRVTICDMPVWTCVPHMSKKHVSLPVRGHEMSGIL